MSAKKTKFEDELKYLEEIVEKMESGVGIEEALTLYEKGMNKSKILDKRLAEIEQKVYQVKNLPELDEGENDKMDLGLFNE